MTKPPNLTVTILREIRDEIRATNVRLDATNLRLDESNQRLGAVESAVVETNQRLGAVEGALVELAQQQRFVVRKLGAGRERDTRLERHVEALDARVGAIEARLGPAR